MLGSTIRQPPTLLDAAMSHFTGAQVIRANGNVCPSLNLSNNTSLKSSAKYCLKSFGEVDVMVTGLPPGLTKGNGLGHDQPANLRAYQAADMGPLTLAWSRGGLASVLIHSSRRSANELVPNCQLTNAQTIR